MIHESIQHSDSELVKLALASPDFFGVLIERYRNKLSRYIRRITRVNKEDEEDILQDVFIQAYTNLNGFDSSLSFNSWIYRITHNKVIDWNRKHRRQQNNGLLEIDDADLMLFFGENNTIKNIDNTFHKKAIEKAFNNIKDAHREILVLKFIEGKSYTEISDILKKPEGTVGTLVHRAKQSFKEYYDHEI